MTNSSHLDTELHLAGELQIDVSTVAVSMSRTTGPDFGVDIDRKLAARAVVQLGIKLGCVEELRKRQWQQMIAEKPSGKEIGEDITFNEGGVFTRFKYGRGYLCMQVSSKPGSGKLTRKVTYEEFVDAGNDPEVLCIAVSEDFAGKGKNPRRTEARIRAVAKDQSTALWARIAYDYSGETGVVADRTARTDHTAGLPNALVERVTDAHALDSLSGALVSIKEIAHRAA